MSKKKTKKIYCFQYYVSDDTIYQYEYLADVLNCSYLIDIDDDDVLIMKSDMDTVKEFKHTSEGDIVYMYTDKDDVNYALSRMVETYNDVLNKLQSGVNAVQTRLSALTATSERIKEKYPTGKKPEKKTKKIYCFQYRFEDNTVHRFECDASVYGRTYVIDIDGEKTVVAFDEMDLVLEHKTESGGCILNLYTERDDVTHAINRIAEAHAIDVLKIKGK